MYTNNIWKKKDKPSALLLSSIFGGKVYDHKIHNLTRWMVHDIKNVTNIVKLINGRLRTPKINAFHNFIDFLNAKGNNIMKLSLDTSPLNSNAWLTGFIDVVGCFSIKGFSSNPGTHLAIQFYLSQRAYDISGMSLNLIMLKLADFLSVKLSQRIMSDKYLQFVINTSNCNSNQILINYLNTYPLLSSKYLDFNDWKIANNIYINKLHKDPVKYEKLRI